MAITMADITQLRKMTGAGMMDCKNALTEAAGNIDDAIAIIRKRGQAIAAKRADREASEGCVVAGTKGTFAATVALKCETDFVAKNEDFVALTNQILEIALTNKPTTVEALLALSIDGRLISDLVLERSGITGEKMEVALYSFVEAPSVVSYIHFGNKLATIVGFNQQDVDTQVMKDVAMQAAAMNPVSVSRDAVPADIKAKEFEIGRAKAIEEGKPENMADKIAEGRLNKFYKESCLLEQEFVKDSKLSVQQYLTAASKELTATAFSRVTLNVD